jgi:dTDP-4-amino-4,6-dideoxygalactose transaminase
VDVPFADLHQQYLGIKSDIDHAISEVIRASAFVRGPFVDRFEQEFAALTGAPHCVSCANGTDALYIAMHALGIQPGDEVIAPAHSWISTTETITQAGGKVVFCDIDPHSYCIDPNNLEALITSRTVGIIPVHLYGQPADMDAIMAIVERYGLWVIEDCAQAHLATYKGRLVGSFGNVAAYSFYPGKNLGAMGDAGALTTADSSLAERMAMFARHGGLRKGDHQIEGINSRLDGLQAAILSVKLAHLPEWTAKRRKLAAHYRQQLTDLESLVLPASDPDSDPVWHLFVIRHQQRDLLAQHLSVSGVQTVVNYPVSLPFLPAYKRYGHQPDHFPVSFAHQSQVLSLPLFPEMTDLQVDYVEQALRSFTI